MTFVADTWEGVKETVREWLPTVQQGGTIFIRKERGGGFVLEVCDPGEWEAAGFFYRP